MKKTCFILVTLAVFLFMFIPAFADECIVPAMGKELLADIHVMTDTPAIEDAAAKYISKIMPHKKILQVSRPSGLTLPEPDKSVYMDLREFISKVAAGEIGYTEYQIPYEDLFDTSFTAEELGIERIILDGTIPEETLEAAQNAMYRKLDTLNPVNIVTSLVTDMVYELYWHDKSEGHGTRVSYVIESYQATESTITVNGYISVRMSVSQDYALWSVSNQGETVYNEYEVDTEYGQHARMAAENAQAIINEHRNKNDEEKLIAYRDAICALTDYNQATNDEVPYGNPWQIVWVFDGDPDTQVVCEGYAKAFQYLCDLGTKEVTTICVQGQTNGPHMWNIVTVNGHNYLVDLTQYDVGFDLYMKGCSDGDPDTGYTIHHNMGTTKYTYSELQSRSREELTLFTKDYTEWKTDVEKIPEVQISSSILYPGTTAMARIVNEKPELMPECIMIRKIIRDETGEIKNEIVDKADIEENKFLICSAGEYTFSVIRDGVESPATEPVILTVEELSDGSTIRLPAGTEVCMEVFAGDSEIKLIEAENCILRTGAFAGSGAVLVCLSGNCTVEAGAFDVNTTLCIEDESEWIEGHRFVIR